jgi:uncharacterized membrane protein
LLLGVGIASTLAGAIFFFAYNWAELHKFVRLGMVQFLILVGIVAVFMVKDNMLVKNSILMGTSMLVGLLFSVFGQIYQTGADAYDFFLGWTVFVLLWAIISEFPPLWLMLILLINATFSLYVAQAGPNMTTTTTYLILALINLAAIILVKVLAPKKQIIVPGWFDKVLAIMIVSCFTICLVANKYTIEWFVALPICIAVYGGGVLYGLRNKSIYLLCLIPLSTILIVLFIVLNILSIYHEYLYLSIGLVIVACISFLVMWLAKLNKAWNGNN